MPLENFSSCSFDQAILLGIFHWAFFIRSFFWLCYQSFFNGWLDQAILTCGLASERNFPIKCGLANMRNNFFATKKTKKHRRWFSRKKFTGRPGGQHKCQGEDRGAVVMVGKSCVYYMLSLVFRPLFFQSDISKVNFALLLPMLCNLLQGLVLLAV